MFHEYHRDHFTISTNPDLLDIDVIHSFLSRSYWAEGISKKLVVKAIKNSLCFALFDRDEQIGFARVVTDYTRFAYMMDVFVLEAYQGRGLGRWLVECIMACLSLQGIPRMLLATSDAHEFYRKLGFEKLSEPDKLMQKVFDQPGDSQTDVECDN